MIPFFSITYSVIVFNLFFLLEFPQKAVIDAECCLITLSARLLSARKVTKAEKNPFWA